MKNNDKTQLLLENEDLFHATLFEFSHKSYSLASTNEIIKNSNINKGSFYYRFSNKEELFTALMDYVFVIQIDLFNRRKIALSEIDQLDVLLYEIFFNLYELYNIDKQYYHLVVSHIKDSESKEIIINYCIEPLKLRLFRRIESFSHIDNYYHILTLVETLYHNFPQKLLESTGFDKDLRDFIDFLLAKEKPQDLKSSFIDNSIESFEPRSNITYMLTKNKDILIPSKYISISKEFFNYDSTRLKISKMTKFVWISYLKTVYSILKKSFKEVNYLNTYLDKDLINFVRKDKNFRKFILSCFYFNVIEQPYIVIDFIQDIFSKEEIKLFYTHILPSMSKTSKILVLSNEYEFTDPIENIYLVDSLSQIKVYNLQELSTNLYKKVEIEYLEDNKNKILKIIDINDLLNHDFINAIKDLKINNIKTITNLDYKSIIRNEEII